MRDISLRAIFPVELIVPVDTAISARVTGGGIPQ